MAAHIADRFRVRSKGLETAASMISQGTRILLCGLPTNKLEWLSEAAARPARIKFAIFSAICGADNLRRCRSPIRRYYGQTVARAAGGQLSSAIHGR